MNTNEGEYLRFDTSIYLLNGQEEYLFSRGFINSSLHLSKQTSPECEFTLQQKNYMIRDEKRVNKSQPVVFGTEILIRHIYSNEYMCIMLGEDGNQVLCLRSEINDECYFEILPQRTFEHKGDFVNLSSTFVVRHSKYKCYMGCNLFENEPLRHKMEQKLKSSKIMQSYRLIKSKEMLEEDIRIRDDPNKSFCLENDKSQIEQQLNKRQNLLEQIKKTQCKMIKIPSMSNEQLHGQPNQYESSIFLPIHTGSIERSHLKHCIIEKHVHTMWKVEVKENSRHSFLSDNDYIYFISSNKNKGLMNVNKKSKIEFIRNQGENQYVCSAIFIVQMVNKETIYLKHLLTGKYFPFNEHNHKKKLKLVALLPLSASENKLPPFHLFFDGEFYPKQMIQDQNTCGFWLNRVNKLQINEILSLYGISHKQWIPYLIKYLDENRKRRQQILQQFRFINFILEKVIPHQHENQSTYKLLFKTINMNPNIRKEMIDYITQILKENNKEYIIDILSQILDNQDNLTEKYINSYQLEYVVKEFIRQNVYSITYMRIFRLFCGHYSQPCQRNQNAIFNLFFTDRINSIKSMTQSILKVENHQMPAKFKFKIIIKKQSIFFENCAQSYKYSDLSYEQQQFIRQYFYLLGDCIKLNKTNAEYFKDGKNQSYSLQNLLYVLQNKQLQKLRAPILNLINAAYLQPEYRYKLYVFINQYENMCYNGELIALNQSENIERLIKYITIQIESIRITNEQIDDLKAFIDKNPNQKNEQVEMRLEELYDQIKREYKSTKFKHLLVMIKYTIQNSYWKMMSQLFMIMDTLAKLYKNKKDINLQGQSNYEQINEWKNYMDSTILSIKIAILFFDIQINLCISNLITLSENKVEQQINNFIKKIESDKDLKHDFNCFQLCDSENPELIKKSLILSRKFYEIKSIIYQKYNEAVRQRKSTKNMKRQIQLIKDTIDHLKLSSADSIEVCKSYIMNCMEDIKIEVMYPSEIIKKGYVLNSIYKYKEMVSEFQVLAYKLGVLQFLCDDLCRYINLRSKDRSKQKESIYWKLLLLYVIIKGNNDLLREVSSWRAWLINLVTEQNQISLIVIDILEQIYRDNRSIVVSDVNEICSICGLLFHLLQYDNKHELCSSNFLNIKINRLMNLISAFLVIEGKKIKNNYQIVINELFDKDNIIQYILKLKNIQNYNSNRCYQEKDEKLINNNHLFQILLFQLTETLEQKPEKIGFNLPSLGYILDLIDVIGRKNWLLTFKIYNNIQPKNINNNKFDEQHRMIKVLRSTINLICELVLDYNRRFPEQDRQNVFKNSSQLTIVFAHFPILIKITKIIIENTFIQTTKYADNVSPLRNTNKLIKDKLYLLERVFLFKTYLPKHFADKLQQIAEDNRSMLELDDFHLQCMNRLVLSDFKIQQIREQKRLVDKMTHLQLKENTSIIYRVSRSKHELLLQNINWARVIIENSGHIKSQSAFSIQLAKQFIKSLIYINKSDSKILDTELKSFFISFLINTFPISDDDTSQKSKYSEELIAHQRTLIKYGTAELISIILEEKFKEGYNLFINLFQLGNKLLESGNEETQEEFLKIFKYDHKNIIFQNITFIIENSMMGVKFYYYYNKSDIHKTNLQFEIAYSSGNEQQTDREKKEVCEILKKIFRFLQLLCENDNQNLKKYILSQTNEANVVKYMSINFIQIAINILIQFIDIISFNLQDASIDEAEIRTNLIEVVYYILEFLIEVCQYPATKNQIYICNSDFFNIIKVITEIRQKATILQKETIKSIFSIERKIVLLLRGLLQQRNSEIIETISKKLQVQNLKELIKSSLSLVGATNKNQLEEYLNTRDDKLIEEIENVVDILIIFRVLGFNIKQYFVNEEKDILLEIDKKIREIQVDFKGQLTNIYFCYRPIFDYLSESTRNFFINKSSMHESRNQKLRDLINSRHIINQDILNRKSRQLIMSQKGINNMFNFSIWLCFVLISLQLFFFTVNKNGIAMDFLEANIVQGLALMQFIISTIYFMLWGINISPITKQKLRSQQKFVEKNANSKWINGYKYYYHLIWQIYFEQNTSLHALLLLTLSFFSCFFQIRLYALVLLYIFAKIELLSSILTAIRLTWGKLLIVCLLATAFSFIFGFLSINNYIKVLYENQSIDIDIEHISSHCSTIMGCIDSLYTQRIIGESPGREGDSSHYGRFFSDVIYWAFFDILLTNIIAAIIIDKFAELRNIKEKIQNEKRNRCFICFAEKSSIERKNQNFDGHVLNKHSVWDYFYYLYYLEKLKSHTQYTGIEYWIVKQVKGNMIDWFPIDESLKDDYNEKKINVMFQLFRKKLENNDKESPQQ